MRWTARGYCDAASRRNEPLFDAVVVRAPDFFFQAEDGIRDTSVTGVQTCALPILRKTAATCQRASSSARSQRCWRWPAASPWAGARSEERRVGKEGGARRAAAQAQGGGAEVARRARAVDRHVRRTGAWRASDAVDGARVL